MQDYQDLLDQAYDFLNNERYGDALKSFNRAFQLQPGETEPLVQMALVFKAQGDADGAVGLLNKAVEIGPPDAFVLLNLGLLYYEAGHYGQSEASLQEAVEIIEHGTASLRDQLIEGDFESSEAIRAQCDELDETAGFARKLLIDIRTREHESPQAGADAAKKQLFESAVENEKRDNTQAAMEDYEHVLAIDENDLRARLNLATLRNAEGSREDALEHLVIVKTALETQVEVITAGGHDLAESINETPAALLDNIRVVLEHATLLHDQIKLRLMFAEAASRRIERSKVERHLPALAQGKPIRIGVLVTLWKRHALADLVLSRCNSIREQLAPLVELELTAVGSEGETSRRLAEQNGFRYIEQPNDPLGAKRNAGLRTLADRDLDAVAFIDSDDFVSERLFTTYAVALRAGYAVLGLLDMHILDLESLRACYWPGYGPKGGRKGETLGMARCVNRDLLDRLDWNLWENSLNRRLDGSMVEHLAAHLLDDPDQFPIGTISTLEHGITAIDVKTHTNLWSFDQMVSGVESVHQIAPMELLKDHFSDREAGRLLSMSDAANQVSRLLAAGSEIDGLAA